MSKFGTLNFFDYTLKVNVIIPTLKIFILFTAFSVIFLGVSEKKAELFVPYTDEQLLQAQSDPLVAQAFSLYSSRDKVKRVSLLSLNSLVFDENNLTNLKNRNRIVLNLFEDYSVSAQLTNLEVRNNNDFTWFGKIDGDILGQVVITVKDDHFVGRVSAGGRGFELKPVKYGVWSVAENHFGKFECQVDKKFHQHTKNLMAQNRVTAQGDTVTDGSYMDMMVVYTSTALANDSNITTTIQNTVDSLNSSLAASCAKFRIRLVHTVEVAYTESGSPRTDLGALAGNGDGTFDEIHSWRTTYGADLVSFWTFSPAAMGYKPDFSATNAQLGFSIMSPFGGLTVETFLHEIGHNFGIGHDRWSDEAGQFDYADDASNRYAYVDTNNNFATNVARGGTCFYSDNNCFHQDIYSNPRIIYNGYPMGKAGIADAISLMNNTTKNHIPYYTQSASSYSPDVTSGCTEVSEEASSKPECFISTATYGHRLHSYIYELRNFRDNTLLKFSLGKLFVSTYYKHSPQYAKIISQSSRLKVISRLILSPIIMIISFPLISLLALLGMLILFLGKKEVKAC